jgi:hypothetical protein
MKASDLRIGNWYKNMSNDNPFNQIKYGHEIDYVAIYCEPIQLTEEWLLKFGGRKTIVEDYPIYFVNPFDIEFYKNESVVLISGNTEVKIKYVHQLQNLYFALTGEELTFK